MIKKMTNKNTAKNYNERYITISISRQNYEKLKTLGFAGDSFNDVMDRLLSKYKMTTTTTKLEEE